MRKLFVFMIITVICSSCGIINGYLKVRPVVKEKISNVGKVIDTIEKVKKD